MDPLTAQLLVGIGTPLVGRLFAGSRPKTPDVYTPAVAQLARRRGVMNTRMDQANAQMQGDLAAAGATGSAGASHRERLFRAGNDAQLDFDALAMDTLTRANNAQQYFDYQDKMGTYDARLEGVADLGESISDYMGSRKAPAEDNMAAELRRLREASMGFKPTFTGEIKRPPPSRYQRQLTQTLTGTPRYATDPRFPQ
jgi:hypothetical protein